MRLSSAFSALAILALSVLFETEPRCQPVPSQAPQPPLVLVNVTVIDGRGGQPLAARDVVIRGGRIAEITATANAPLPDGATVLDLPGHYVMPGLVDAHVHLPANREELAKILGFLFDGGVTAVRDMGGDASLYTQFAPETRTPQSLWPRLYYSAYWAGPSFWDDRRWKGMTGDRKPGEVPWAMAITEETNLVDAVRAAKALGVTAIKIYSDLSPPLVRRIAAEAHRAGLLVWSHAAVFPTRPAEVAIAGVDTISHSALFVWEGVQSLPSGYHVEPFTDFGPIGPYDSVSAESPAIGRVLDEMRRRNVVLDATVSTVTQTISPAAAAWSFRLTAEAKRRGVAIAAGTDRDEPSTPDGYPMIFEEIEALVAQAGLSPLEALTAATRNGARTLGMEATTGTVEPGKLADLVVVRADPTVDIRNARRVVYVIKEGHLHRASRAAH